MKRLADFIPPFSTAGRGIFDAAGDFVLAVDFQNTHKDQEAHGYDTSIARAKEIAGSLNELAGIAAGIRRKMEEKP